MICYVKHIIIERRRKDLEIMYGDDSDEELYDKTKRKSKKVEKAETYDELVVKQQNALKDIEKIEKAIQEKKRSQLESKKNAEEEDLDSYMTSLSKKPLSNDKSLFALQKELTQLKKVITI